MNKVNEWNDRIANILTNALSNMWLFWILNVLIWTAILIQHPRSLEDWLLAIISVWFQGVSLVVINRTSQKQGDRVEGVLREIHDAVMTELTEIRRMNESQTTELAEIKAIHRELGRRAHER
ncbi:hypothetical protein [Alicyclobacillus sendaiensis]|uniref:hypothetical protein n=1 Tax=Alicyclobacillus sendaiensis TaxID=192387 RepID=UPI0026F472F8|nr:hypothetical protein [Alicyclobacillus sendaiensis]